MKVQICYSGEETRTETLQRRERCGIPAASCSLVDKVFSSSSVRSGPGPGSGPAGPSVVFVTVAVVLMEGGGTVDAGVLLVVLMLTSVGLGESYMVGGWTSA